MKAFKDISIFSGWTEYQDESGQWWRRENKGITFLFYQQIGDVFVAVGSLCRPATTKTIKAIHNLYLEVC